MKQTVYLLGLVLVAFVSCTKDEDPAPKSGETEKVSLDATSKTTWQYFSFSEKAIVGNGEEDSAANASWFARDDWDIAIRRYNIRTNSGDATTIGANGGVYACEEHVEFISLDEVPVDAVFEKDKMVTKSGHGGSYDITMSKAQVIQFKTNTDGSLVMPPVYLSSPVYIFKTADGGDTYKVNFTQYINDDGVSGHVEFEMAQLY